MESIDRRDFCKRFGLLVGVGFSANLPIVSFAEEKNLFAAKVATTSAKSNINFAAFLIGEKLGYFAKEGIRQEMIDFRGAGDTIRAVTAGTCHYAGASLMSAAIAFEKGETIKVIGSGYKTLGLGWLTRYDSSIKSLEDIKGKKIGFSVPGTVSSFFIFKALKAAGLTTEDVKLVGVGSPVDAWTAVKTGVVDVGYSVDPIISKVVRSKEGRIVFWSDDHVSDWSNVGITTTEDFMEKHPDILNGFVKAYLKACDFIINNPEKSGEMIAETMGIDKELGIMSIKNIPQKAWTLQFTELMLKNIDEGLLEMKLIKKPVEWKKLIDQRFLPQHMRIKLP